MTDFQPTNDPKPGTVGGVFLPPGPPVPVPPTRRTHDRKAGLSRRGSPSVLSSAPRSQVASSPSPTTPPR